MSTLETPSSQSKPRFLRSAERHDYILTFLRQHRYAYLGALAEHCHTSLQTIRRDISVLESQGLVEKGHGTVSLANLQSAKTFATDMQERRSPASVNTQLGIVLAKIIPSRASVLIGGGAVMPIVTQGLCSIDYLSVVTNSLPVATVLYQQSQFELNLIGGSLSLNTGSLVGQDTAKGLTQFFPDFCLFTVAGIAPDGSLLETDSMSASLTQAMLNNARTKVLIAESHKFQVGGITKAGGLGEIDYLITNQQPDSVVALMLEKLNITCYVVDF